MANNDTLFVQNVTPVNAPWANDVNVAVMQLLGNSTGPGGTGGAPTSTNELLTNIQAVKDIPTYTSAVTFINSTLPVNGQTVSIASSDGGPLWNVVTGAALGTYTSNGNGYCGTILASTDGSAALLRQYKNVITPQMFGAQGDGIFLNSSSVSITSGTNALTVVGASFTSSDAGKSIFVPGMGASGADIWTTISSVIDATHVVLAVNASTTLSAVAERIVYGTDDTTTITAAFTAAEALGIGVFYPPGAYGQTDVHPASGVEYYGAGVDSVIYLIENSANTAHPFYASGLDRATYYQRNWKALNNITPGNSVTCTTPADAATYAVGDKVVVASTGALISGTDWQPYYAILNKVLSVDTTTGAIGLESPIYDSITGAQIAKENDFVAGYAGAADTWVYDATFRDLTFDLTTTPRGIPSQWFSSSASYRVKGYNVNIYGGCHTRSANGDCYCDFHDIYHYGWSEELAASGGRVAEIKTGSYDSSYDLTVRSGANFTTSVALVETGEYANHIRIKARIDAGAVSVSFPYVAGVIGSVGVNNKFNVTAKLAACESFLSTNQQTDISNPNYTGLEFNDCEIDSPNCAQLIRVIAPTTGFSSNWSFNRCKSLQPLVTYAGTVASSISFSTDLYGLNDCEINDCEGDGPLYFNNGHPLSTYGTVGLTINRCKVSSILLQNGYDSSLYYQPWQLQIKNLNRINASDILSPGYEENVPATYVNTVGTTTLYSEAFPAWGSANWVFGDGIDFEITGEFIGTAGTKTVTLTESVGAVTLANPSSTAAGHFRIWGSLTYYGGSSVSGLIFTDLNGTITAVPYLETPANLNLSLSGTIGTTGDDIRFYKQRITPKLAYA